MCDMLLINQIDTILDMVSLDDEYIKVIYKLSPNSKTRIHVALP